MSWQSKVLWTEGLFLQPHHFQQADRYAEGLVAGLAQRIAPYAWGLSSLELDYEALKVGQFAIRSCSGLTPDGTVFRIPEAEDHPPALDVPAGVKDCVVLLTVPQRRQGASEVDLSGSELSASRLRPAEIEVTDTMGGSRTPTTLAVGKMRLQFALETDDLADRLGIPVARIVEVRADKEIVLDTAFMASCLDLRAAPPLAEFLQELEGKLGHRMTALAGRLTAGGARGTAEIQDVLILGAINRALPVLRHLKSMENVHPADFYRDCLAL
ncbi:type VI secretion system baseplate subunit TssK, partial [Pseudooceanicola sp. C21-150M6]|uniref:type VI secretion system baseplate subunit TssK n=1 Tax=Pseudooceanicola sp. C21-150M6 TaxID=3434355 RepID=UPI003D7F34DE